MNIFRVKFWFASGYYFDDGSNIILGKTRFDEIVSIPFSIWFDNFMATIASLFDPQWSNPGFCLDIVEKLDNNNEKELVQTLVTRKNYLVNLSS